MQGMSWHHPLAGFQPEDDIDKLFNKLPPIEPPGEVLSRLLSLLKGLPTTSVSPAQPGVLASEESETLIVRNEKREPS